MLYFLVTSSPHQTSVLSPQHLHHASTTSEPTSPTEYERRYRSRSLTPYGTADLQKSVSKRELNS